MSPRRSSLRSLILAIVGITVFSLALIPATATGQERKVTAPPPTTTIRLEGEVWANGVSIGLIEFAVIFSEDDPTKAQLWADLEGPPVVACSGDIFETPSGEPIFFGSTPLTEPAGTCYMSQLPDDSGVALFVASNDGRWASSILYSPNRIKPVPIFD